MSVGRPISIRLPSGTAEKIRAITGRPAGEVIREMAVAYVLRAEADLQRKKSNV